MTLDLQEKLLGQGDQILSVTQVSNLLKRHVENSFSKVRVKAEISGLKVHTSGHAYFTLKDQDAVIDGVMWRGTPTKTKLIDGAAVIATGKITTYPARSKYQMVVEQLEDQGQGELMKLLLERKAAFEKEGLFQNARPIPKFPKIIGVVTSPTGAVIQDILHRIKDRFPCCHILLWPVLVQGTGASQQVADAVRGFNAWPGNKPDVLIVARGGGSFEDLWPFNDECVVRAVHESRIPVISAVGHETDTTLIDYAADLRAPTPTAAAELATPVLLDLIVYLTQSSQRLINAYMRILQNYRMRYQLASKSFIDPQKYVNEKAQRLDDWSQRLDLLRKSISVIYFQRLQMVSNRLTSPKMQMEIQQQRLIALSHRLQQNIALHIDKNKQTLDFLSIRLQQSSFENTLSKGFCLMMDKNKKALQTVHDLQNCEDTAVTFHMKDGQVISTLKDVQKIA